MRLERPHISQIMLEAQGHPLHLLQRLQKGQGQDHILQGHKKHKIDFQIKLNLHLITKNRQGITKIITDIGHDQSQRGQGQGHQGQQGGNIGQKEDQKHHHQQEEVIIPEVRQ